MEPGATATLRVPVESSVHEIARLSRERGTTMVDVVTDAIDVITPAEVGAHHAESGRLDGETTTRITFILDARPDNDDVAGYARTFWVPCEMHDYCRNLFRVQRVHPGYCPGSMRAGVTAASTTP